MGEDGLDDSGDFGGAVFLEHLDEGAEEVEGHGVAGEEVIKETVLFDGLVLLLVGDTRLGILKGEVVEEILASLFSPDIMFSCLRVEDVKGPTPISSPCSMR